MIVEGAIATKAIIENQKRSINKLYLVESKHSKDINYILHLAHKCDIVVERISRKRADELAIGKTHGGILLDCDTREYEPVDKICGNQILLIEGIEDPYNLGMIMRTAYIMNVSAIITTYRDLKNSEPVLIKASAGASERLQWTASNDLEQTLSSLKIRGYTLYAALRNKESLKLHDVKFNDKMILAIGGEKRGLSKAVIGATDSAIFIPYQFNARIALSAVSATSMCLYEVNRQRLEKMQ